MENNILELTFELKDIILESEVYKELVNSERKMLEDKDCFSLLNEYDKVKDEYNEAKRFEKYGCDVASVQKKLSEIKYKVDENKFVKDYIRCYKNLKKQLKIIEKILFKDIIGEKKEMYIE